MSGTEPPRNSLLAKTAKGAGWIICWRMATRLLGLVNTLVLVRLLLPADFGLVALGASLAQSVDALSILGVQDAVVREKHPDRAMYDTAFTMNAIRGVLTAMLVGAAALPMAAFFSDPRLANILYALSAGLMLSSFENIGTVDFRRNLTFEREFQLLVLPRMAGIILAILCAFAWRNYWALVVGSVSTRVLRLILSYVMHPYRPRPGLAAWRSITGFSIWSWIISIAELLRDRSDSFVIGRLLGTTAVGVYSVGLEIALLPASELVEPLGRACFSSFSAARHTGVSPAETYLRVIATTALFTLPAGFGISLVADPLIKLAFGPRWVEAVPLVEILAAGSTVAVFGYISSVMFSANALLRTNFNVTMASFAVRIVLLVLLVWWLGLVGAALAAAISIGVEQGLYVIAVLRRFDVRGRGLVQHTWRCLAATASMAAVLFATGLGWHAAEGGPLAQAGRIAVSSGAGAMVYGATLLGLWLCCGRPRGAETDLIEILRRGLGRLRGILRRARLEYSAVGTK